MKSIAAVFALLVLSGCMGVPKNITPVDNFILDKYLGQWYEIARLDHPFERGLDNVTAYYSLREDGGITIKNRGYSHANKVWKEAEGKAYFAKNPDQGHLKVSFFGPFYSSYVVFDLDETNYQYAFVSGYSTSYLWLLSRTPTIDKKVVSEFLTQAKMKGFDTDKILFVNHDMQ